jgi:hypothetical protein
VIATGSSQARRLGFGQSREIVQDSRDNENVLMRALEGAEALFLVAGLSLRRTMSGSPIMEMPVRVAVLWPEDLPLSDMGLTMRNVLGEPIRFYLFMATTTRVN